VQLRSAAPPWPALMPSQALTLTLTLVPDQALVLVLADRRAGIEDRGCGPRWCSCAAVARARAHVGQALTLAPARRLCSCRRGPD